MTTPQSHAEYCMEGSSRTEEMDNYQKSLKDLQTFSLDDKMQTRMPECGINEQSSLICMLKQKTDELLLRCEALQKSNSELELCLKDCQTERDGERKRAELIERRFMDLASNNQAIIAFMAEYKNQNGLLQLENKRLQAENDSLFSKKIQETEELVKKLRQEIKLLTESYTNKENEYREKLQKSESKLLEQATRHQKKEELLLDQFHDSQRQHRDAVELCKDLELKLQKAEEEHTLKETSTRGSITSLTREKDKLMQLSIERGKLIQDKQEEIRQLETKVKEERKARIKTEDRFHKEAEAVKADLKVKSLQSALDEVKTQYGRFRKDVEAYKEHSSNLLQQERELNKKLRHMMG